jgi:hypothetical protein
MRTNKTLGNRMKPPKETTTSENQDRWWSSHGIVYFFAAGNPAKAIKIGVTALTKEKTIKEAVVERFRHLQTSNHETVELLGIIYFSSGKYPTRDAEILERELHIRFSASQRFKPNTRGCEWFTPTEELFLYINENSSRPESLELPSIISKPINRTN